MKLDERVNSFDQKFRNWEILIQNSNLECLAAFNQHLRQELFRGIFSENSLERKQAVEFMEKYCKQLYRMYKNNSLHLLVNKELLFNQLLFIFTFGRGRISDSALRRVYVMLIYFSCEYRKIIAFLKQVKH